MRFPDQEFKGFLRFFCRKFFHLYKYLDDEVPVWGKCEAQSPLARHANQVFHLVEHLYGSIPAS